MTGDQIASAVQELCRLEDPAIASARIKLLGIAQARLAGKEHAPRRPPLTLNLVMKGGGIVAVIKPQILNSKEGWTIGRLEIQIKVSGQQRFQATVAPTGALQGPGFHYRGGVEAADVARKILRMFDAGMASVLAMVDAFSCCICGRALTDPDSRAVGIGPECIQHFSVGYRLGAGINPAAASPADIAEQIAAIRKQIQQEHPDRGGTADGERMAELTAALAALKQELQQQ